MDIIEGFKNPARKYSPVAFWFWNSELNPEFLVWQIDEMIDKGVYGAFMHARAYLKTPYLEDGWWEAVDRCVERGRKKGFYTWLYDEYAWPSGTAGSTFEFGFQKPSRVLAEGEKNMAKGLYVRIYASGEDINQENLLAKFPMLDGSIMAFYRRIYPRMVDYLNKETIRAFINCTHEEYKKRYGSDFGTVIPGVFFDEIYMIGYPLPWTDSLPEEFMTRCGYDLMKELPHLMEGEDSHARQVRKDYYRVITELYEEAFFVQISDWCEKNNLKLTGHTEEYLLSHPRRQGNFFQTMRHLQIPGADNHDYRYRFPRKITFCEPKYSVSVARAYNKERCMSEAMGGAGWGCSLQEFKRGINTMGAMGINMFTLHGFYNDTEHQGSQADWPTSFFYQNPYWKYFKTFGDYISRVCYMNSIGRPVVDIALYYPIHELYEETIHGDANERGRLLSQGFDIVLNCLLNQQMDTDMIDRECILRAVVSEGRINVGQQSFSTLICPSDLIVDEMLKEKLMSFVDSGGYLVFYSSKSGETAPEPFSSCLVCLPQSVPEVLNQFFIPDVKVVEGGNTEIYVNHRAVGNTHFYMISNSTNERRHLTIALREKGKVYRMNPENGNITPVSYSISDQGTIVKIDLYEDEACFLLLDNNEVPSAIEESIFLTDRTVIPITGSWSFLPLPKEYDSRWDIDAEHCILDIPVAVFSSESGNRSQLIRICNKKGEIGSCGRYLSNWNASWIGRRTSWVDDADADNLYFRKVVMVQSTAKEAHLCIAAVNSFTLYINGKLVCSAKSNCKPVEVDILPFLTENKNVIAVHVQNETPLPGKNLCEAEFLPPDRIISLLLEGYIITSDGKVHIATDNSWIVSKEACEKWNDIDTDLESKALVIDPKKCTSFSMNADDNTWVYAWERGRPPLQPWGHLPLFGSNISLPQQIAYSLVLPAGTVMIVKPQVRGEFDCLLDGLPIEFQNDSIPLVNDGRSHTLIIQVKAKSLKDGLLQPVRVMVKPYNVPLGDWRLQGLTWFSGRVMYYNTFTVKKNENQCYMLDLGDVRFNAEIWVNRKLVGIRIWAPYCIDITDALVDGMNELNIIVANSAAVERRNMLVDEGMALGWNRYWNEDNIDREPQNLVSGLLGPVNLYIK